jgi:hypothetical protein
MKLPDRCPACGADLRVTRLTCQSCETVVNGRFRVCDFCALPDPERELLELFLRSRGNVKEVQRELGVSYPTVRSRLDQLWIRLGYKSSVDEAGEAAETIIESLKSGKLNVEQAAARLRRGGVED